jgi:hypothetical protein
MLCQIVQTHLYTSLVKKNFPSNYNIHISKTFGIHSVPEAIKTLVIKNSEVD